MSAKVTSYGQRMCQGVNFIKPLYWLSSIFGLVPFYDFATKKSYSNLFQKCYSITMGLLILGTYIFCENNKIKMIYPRVKTSEVTLDAILYALLLIFNLTTIFKSSFLKQDAWQAILEALNQFDVISNYKQTVKSLRKFIFDVVVSHLIVFAVLLADIFVWMKDLSMADHVYYLLQKLRLYFVFLPVLIIAYVAVCLKNRFRHVNDSLLSLFCSDSWHFQLLTLGNSVDKKDSLKTEEIQEELKKMKEFFSILSSVVDLCNDIFGIQTLLLFGIILAGELNSINTILIYDTKKEQNYNSANLLANILVTLMLLTWGIIVIFCCGGVNDEAYRTASICYQLSSSMPEKSLECQSLLILGMHSTNRCPQLTAANVFTVNIAALFTFIGSLASYVIVLVQLN